MKLVSGFVVGAVAASAALVLQVHSNPLQAQAPAQQDAAPPITGGGIYAPGWQGKIDPGQISGPGVPSKLEDAKFTKQGETFQIETGPAVSYWNPANVAKGDYTVKATFNEPHFQNRNDHPHPYGIFIAGNDLGTDQNSMIYCEAYGSGTFIVRGFGPAVFRMNGGRGEANPAVHKAAGIGQPVSQEIEMSVKGDNVTCSINGTQVATYPKAQVVGAGKLKSTDGVYGIRFAHNTEGSVTGFGIAK